MYMAFSSTGPLDLQTIGQAAGDTAPHSLNEYYNISFTDGTSSPSTGTISISDFLGKTIGSSYNWTQQIKLTSPDPSYNDQYGYAVSISGDTAVIGAYRESPGFPVSGGMQYATNAGAAYVYVRSGTTWSFQQRLTASDVYPYDYFGVSVSIDGDYIIVGAFYEDPNGVSNAGSAYVFHRSGTTWYEQAKLFPNPLSNNPVYINAYFGRSVSISGDTAIVGAVREDSFLYGPVDTGAAYVYVRSGTTWSFQQRLTSSDVQPYDYFGRSVSIDGDYIIVGAFYEDPNGVTNAGSAYVFHRSGTTWYEQAKLIASQAVRNDYFGIDVNISGDSVVIGVPTRDRSGLTSTGSAFVFVRSGTTWSQQQELTAGPLPGTDFAAGDQFGNSVHIDGNRVIVGANYEDPNGVTNAGSAYIFDRSGTTWTLTTKLVASDAGPSYAFGQSVALSGNTALVGASWTDTPGLYQSDQGAAYVYIT
jgi:hypothetical protein